MSKPLTEIGLSWHYISLHWRHNDHDGVSNHQPHDCLLNRLFRRRSKKTSKFRVTGLCVGNSPGPVNSPHKGPVTRKMFPFDDVIMWGVGKLLYPHNSVGCNYSSLNINCALYDATAVRTWMSNYNIWKQLHLIITQTKLEYRFFESIKNEQF